MKDIQNKVYQERFVSIKVITTILKIFPLLGHFFSKNLSFTKTFLDAWSVLYCSIPNQPLKQYRPQNADLVFDNIQRMIKNFPIIHMYFACIFPIKFVFMHVFCQFFHGGYRNYTTECRFVAHRMQVDIFICSCIQGLRVILESKLRVKFVLFVYTPYYRCVKLVISTSALILSLQYKRMVLD